MKQKAKKTEMNLNCKLRLLAVQDTVDILGGKWKIRILNTLRLGSRHFMDLQRQVDGIGSKMLSSELKGLELNGLVKRTVYDTRPVTVEYELTPYGTTLKTLIEEMEKWGTQHRKLMFKLDQEKTPGV